MMTLLTGCSDSAAKLNKNGVEYYEAGKLDNAMKSFETAVKKDSKNPIYLSNLGKLYYDKEKYDKAIENINKAIKNGAENRQELYYILAECYFEEKMSNEGIQAVEDFVNTNYNDYNNYFKGYEMLNKYELPKTAASLLEQAKKLNSKSGKDANSMGLVYYYLGEYETSIIYFDKARESGYKEAVLNVAKANVELKQYNKAIAAYEYYEKNIGKSSVVSNQKSTVYMLNGEYEKALASIEEGVASVKADEPEVLQMLLYNRIIAYEKTTNYNKALELIEEYLKSYPEDEKAKLEYEFLKTR